MRKGHLWCSVWACGWVFLIARPLWASLHLLCDLNIFSPFPKAYVLLGFTVQNYLGFGSHPFEPERGGKLQNISVWITDWPEEAIFCWLCLNGRPGFLSMERYTICARCRILGHSISGEQGLWVWCLCVQTRMGQHGLLSELPWKPLNSPAELFSSSKTGWRSWYFPNTACILGVLN